MVSLYCSYLLCPLCFYVIIPCFNGVGLKNKTLQVNPDMVSKLENAGLSFVGKDESGNRMEVCLQISSGFSFGAL